MEQYPEEWRQYEPIQPRGGTDWRAALRKLWAPIAALGAFLAKFGVVLLKFKFLFSMVISFGAYLLFGPWWFALGLVVNRRLKKYGKQSWVQCIVRFCCYVSKLLRSFLARALVPNTGKPQEPRSAGRFCR